LRPIQWKVVIKNTENKIRKGYKTLFVSIFWNSFVKKIRVKKMILKIKKMTIK
jgi:hypothetical protein